jgi:hypothetical protein
MKGKGKEKDKLEYKLKYEIARELGLMDKIEEVGWGGLTAKESGKIGGLVRVKKKAIEEKKLD